MFKDRTLEFVQITESLRLQNPKIDYTKKLSSNPSNGTVGPKLQFTIVAGQIGKQLHETTHKLSNLTKLAKNTSLFDDKTVEIQQLTHVIKEDITGLNHQIEALQNHVQSQRLLHKNKHTETHATSIVSSLRSKLARTTKKFQSVLETRTKNLKVQQDKRQKFTGIGNPNTFRTKGDLFNPRPLSFAGPRTNGYNEVAINMDENGTGQHQQLRQQTLLGAQDQYLASRTEAVESIEQTIIELQGIFQQLATIVAEQGEMVQRIDANVDEALANVGGAQEQLIKYLQKISGNRWLVVKVFLVLIVFIVIFVVFFV